MDYRFLAIDCGNTRIKCTVLGVDDSVTVHRVFGYQAIDPLIDWLESERVDGCAMASVHALDTRLVESIRNLLGDKFLLITPHTDLGIVIDYDTPDKLGIDRKIAAVAAGMIYPGKKSLVVDAGTAVTIDMIGENGGFRGGTISPGASLRLESLANGTHLLPNPGYSGLIESCRGNSTEECILAGALGGLLDEIVMAMLRGEKEGVQHVLICGGDGEWIYNNLRNRYGELNIEYQYMPDLIAIGMHEIYRRQS